MIDRELMAEIAILYYEKKLTQQQIAEIMYLSRQTVSKLLNEALSSNIVEITVHHPKKDCEELEARLKEKYGIKGAVVAGSGSRSSSVRHMLTVKAAAEYILPIVEKGGMNIAVSWGRTVRSLIDELPSVSTEGNTVFPLFGATDSENAAFSPNELARSLAEKLGASAKYAWFPYLPDAELDRELLKRTSYYKSIGKLWDNIDLAVVGIGNREIADLFLQTLGNRGTHSDAVGDIATHFFTARGKLLKLYENTLSVSSESLKKAKLTVAVANGSDKVTAIAGALKTGLVDVLVTDEFTARELLA